MSLLKFLTNLGSNTMSVKELFKKAWIETPAVAGGAVLGLIGFGMFLYGSDKYIKNDGDVRIYRMNYIVYRPDDPNVERIKPGDSEKIVPLFVSPYTKKD